MKKVGNKYQLELTWQQMDKVEESADIMAMGHIYVNHLEEAVEFLADKFIAEEGPKYEMEWEELEEEDRNIH